MSGTGPRSIFPRGPTFDIETFSSKNFIVKDFVESLSDSAIPSRRKSVPGAQAFDPKPLIRSFESALSQLADLSGSLDQRETELQTAVRRAEIEHDRTIDTLGAKLDHSIDEYEKLEANLNGQSDTGGNSVALELGERLEEKDGQRQRSKDASFLVQCWMELNEQGELSSLEDVRRQGTGENKVRCAIIAKQLMRISERLDPKSNPKNGSQRQQNGITNGVQGYRGYNTREIIERFQETLEQDLLDQFDASYKRKNYEQASECAKVLMDFNKGTNVMAQFVNQHEFFIDRNQLITDEVTTDGETWDRIADPDAEPPGVEPSLESLVDSVRLTVQEEASNIKKAFPYYDLVLAKFIQRVFQQSIQQRLEMVLEKADTISSLAFLRSLHASRAYINAMVQDLKSHGLCEAPDPCSATITAILDQQVDELFTPYLVGNSYIDRERRSLEELYFSLLFKFTIYHSRRKKVATGFMASLAQQGTQLLGSARDAYINKLDSSDLTPTQRAMMLKVAGLKNNENKNEIEVSDEDGILSIATAKRMLRWLSEGVRRALELNTGTDTPKDVAALLNMLLASMAQVYIETSLEAAGDAAIGQEGAKNEPDLGYFLSLGNAINITALMNRFIITVLIRLAESNTVVRRDMDAKTRGAMRSIEDKTTVVMQKTVDVVANWVSRLLYNQKKNDFRPRDQDLDAGRGQVSYLEQLQTPTCEAICAFLSRVDQTAREALDGENLQVFSSELAVMVRDLLFEHFKKFQVNATGGLMVTKDMSKYMATIKDWHLRKEVENSSDVLGDIGSLFIIGSEALKERARNIQTGVGGAGRGIDKLDFRQFVVRRDDSGSMGVQSVLAGL